MVGEVLDNTISGLKDLNKATIKSGIEFQGFTKALVDAGVPLQISSRAAGAVESNGKVKIKQLFTYDLVADPGFANAELKRVNESYGFDNESGLWIYEMNNEVPEAKEEITTTNRTQ